MFHWLQKIYSLKLLVDLNGFFFNYIFLYVYILYKNHIAVSLLLSSLIYMRVLALHNALEHKKSSEIQYFGSKSMLLHFLFIHN